MLTKNFTCFLIDDDMDDHEFFTLALQDVCPLCKCTTAINCYEALDKLNSDEFKPDFIFLDLNLPLMNGKQFLQEIKKNPKLRQIPVVICSTSSRERDIIETMQLGAANFLIKPSSVKQLAAILTGLFNNDIPSFLLNQQFKQSR